MRRWIEKISPSRALLEKRWFLRPFAFWLARPCAWSFSRRNVARSFAAGLFIAFIPPTPLVPVHFVMCALVGLMLRLNLPVLFATVFISNPLTWVPQVIASIWVGAKLMGVDLAPFVQSIRDRHFTNELQALWSPLLLGAFVLGTASAALGYALAQGVWRVRVSYLLRRRRHLAMRKSRLFD